MKIREVSRIVKGYATKDGAGVSLIRVLGRDDIADIDPFLMMDAFCSENPEDYIRGFPMHPHRGIETITYLLDGRIDHRDSIGNHGSLQGGELQWMTAGSGILHEEMPQAPGLLNGLQFWLNLPAKDKMTTPAYFPITPDMLRPMDIGGGTITVIAGEYREAKGIQSKFVPVTMMDVTLEPHAACEIPVAVALNTFVYLFKGNGMFGEKQTEVAQRSAAIFAVGDTIAVKAGASGVHFVLLAGQPLGQPVAWAGPIVMNTEEELRQAFDELKNGSFVK